LGLKVSSFDDICDDVTIDDEYPELFNESRRGALLAKYTKYEVLQED
jgi:hypothetical protein